MESAQSVPARPAYALGVDVGGTKIAAGIVELESGRILRRRIEPTHAAQGGEAVLEKALALAEALLREAEALRCMIAGIGLGICELVDPAGNITSNHVIDWQRLPVRQRFNRLAPTVLEADVRAAALAEARYGAGRHYKLFAYVTVGTGISSCLVQEGRPFAGARGNALVLATGPITTVCPVCGTTVQTVIEEIASGPAVVARYNRAACADFSRGEEVLAAAQAGKREAIEVVERGGSALGMGVGWLVNVLDPEAVVVGGGLGVAGGLYWSSFVDSARAHIWAEGSRHLPIVQAQLGSDAGLAGAAAFLDVS